MDEALPIAVDVGRFDEVDSGGDSDQFAHWMDHQRTRAPDRLLALLDLGPDDAVLDVGCGTGVDLDAVVATAGHCVGIDLSKTMLRSAQRRGEGGLLLAMADGQDLPFPSESFDAVSCRAVLVHTPAPERTMAEVRRVLKPGGTVILSEPDHGSHMVSTPEIDVFERILQHRRGRFRHPLVGRSLPALASTAGLGVTSTQLLPILHRTLASALASGGPFGVAVEAAVADGAISEDDARRYGESLEALDSRAAFLFAAMSVVVTATA